VALDTKVAEISRGNLEARVDENSSTAEIQHLAQGFNRMTADLRSNVERLAVEKSERQRIERDLDIARQIQQSLLPTSTPDLVGYDIAGWSRTADKTGGDYYDWQILPDGSVLVTLADVSGHGIGPALVAAVCRAYARATIGTEQQDLAAFMQRINDLLMGDLPEDRFVTFAGVLLDPSRHSAQMLSAGHGPLYRCRSSHGALEELAADDLPFGLTLENPAGPAAEFPMEPGDFILLVTDGLFEWSNDAGESFGLERLRQTIRDTSSATSAEIIRALHNAVETFAGASPQLDDITIVVVRRRSVVAETSSENLSPALGQERSRL
jgi:serine phosphatase RsbU (regulator of sigma subunit)